MLKFDHALVLQTFVDFDFTFQLYSGLFSKQAFLIDDFCRQFLSCLQIGYLVTFGKTTGAQEASSFVFSDRVGAVGVLHFFSDDHILWGHWHLWLLE